HRPPTHCVLRRGSLPPRSCVAGEGWSQSPVLPWTQRAYETCLSAGSTAVLAHGQHGNGAPTRNCTRLARLPSMRIAQNALGARFKCRMKNAECRTEDISPELENSAFSILH